ncbi:MAG: peptide-methionine (S)-S-oxide reductase MsrA [Bacilli bacterium]|nr:peptide-methionine (S)-S-oxide reductase MsrA [Bacilli bacterium]MBN2696172.1 peptide-methionine (S)-S-oxide reductase MsrA [Bacilli bacterium]
MKKIILAGGCFWGVEAYYKRLAGIVNTVVGYTDGETENPSYEAVCHASGHAEAVYIEYAEEKISLDKVLEHFFRIIDPTQSNRQGNDIGVQYRSGIYVFDQTDYDQALSFIETLQANYSRPIQTKVKFAKPFYPAEDYHQDYLDKNPGGYCHVNMHVAKQSELKEEYRVKNSS